MFVNVLDKVVHLAVIIFHSLCMQMTSAYIANEK